MSHQVLWPQTKEGLRAFLIVPWWLELCRFVPYSDRVDMIYLIKHRGMMIYDAILYLFFRGPGSFLFSMVNVRVVLGCLSHLILGVFFCILFDCVCCGPSLLLLLWFYSHGWWHHADLKDSPSFFWMWWCHIQQTVNRFILWCVAWNLQCFSTRRQSSVFLASIFPWERISRSALDCKS